MVVASALNWFSAFSRSAIPTSKTSHAAAASDERPRSVSQRGDGTKNRIDDMENIIDKQARTTKGRRQASEEPI